MSKTIDVAKYLIYAYEQISNSRFETQELKLQKLMYFAQRESFALTGEPLFPSDFEGWVHGPVLVELRYFFEQDYVPYNGDSSALSETDKYRLEMEDFRRLSDKYIYDWNSDFEDGGYHMNLFGAIKTTKYVEEYLRNGVE